jgi:predicted CXXCH cytochrome family protein
MRKPLVVLIAALGISGPPFAGLESEQESSPATRFPAGPLPANRVVATHAPFEAGACGVCHERDDAKNPGPATRVTETCLGCHEDFKAVLARTSSHKAATQSCSHCHNAHNAARPMLLHEETSPLCLNCHQKIKKAATESAVRHDALTSERSCLNCHDAHGANVEKLLLRLPFELCVNCHSRDGMVDDKGKALTNVKTMLEQNPVHHGPVAAKDCSVCHEPHGGARFRLLVETYPPEFYAPYSAERYSLCFSCHNQEMLAAPETTTATNFRDGKRNLHYLHVNRSDRGRTCRACHEVHASKQPHQIRDGVPYGAKNWILKLNYSRTPRGGACEKTCHARKEYDNKSAPGSQE